MIVTYNPNIYELVKYYQYNRLEVDYVIIVDNSQRYFSNNRFKTKTPVITRHSSRDSLWKDLDGELFAKYRAITVSNDIEDTTFFFKR